MKLVTEDYKRSIDIGSNAVWMSVYSTVMVRIRNASKKVPLAIHFLANATCDPANCLETARQINLIRDELARIDPSKAVYDMRAPSKKAPWEGNISPVVTSCANLYATADGKDLLFELVSILVYGSIAKTSIIVS